MNPGVSKIESLDELNTETGGEYSRWISELDASDREIDKWRRQSRKIVKEFRADHSERDDDTAERRFNLFAANVNILQTSLINQSPAVTVDREFKDPNDDIARVATSILERAISAHNNKNFHTFDMLKQVVQDMLVPGLGGSWHTYEAEIEHHEAKEDATGAEAMEYDEVIKEDIVDEYVYWEDINWSPARSYDEVRWISRKVYMTRDKLVERFGPEKGKRVPLNAQSKKTDNNVETKHQIFQQACIYEIWDKPSRQITWLTRGSDTILDQKDDFLELDGFFPCPKFLTSTVSNGQYIPIPDYRYARSQYQELNQINTRIALLVKACRVAGVFDKASDQVPKLLNDAAENVLVGVDQWAAFAEKGGIKGVIDWLPLDQVVICLEQLLKNREDVKQQIYEVTGMSDIIRGQTKASETLGAQKIKTQYASMRIQERQKNTVQYCSSIYQLQSELMRKHMGADTIGKLAQVQFMNEAPEIVQQALELIKAPEFVLRSKVESDTLSDVDFQAEKQDRMEYMMTITNYLKEILPVMQNDPIMGPFLMQLLQFSLAGFKIGKKFEGELDRTFEALQKKLANPPPPQPSPEQQKAQAQIELMKQKGQMDAQQGQQKLALQREEGQQKMQLKSQENQLKLVGAQQKAHVDQQIASQKLEQSQVEHQAQTQQTVQSAQIQEVLQRQKFQNEQKRAAQEFAQMQETGDEFSKRAKS